MTENSELIQTNPILDLFQNMQNINSQTIANAPIELEFPKNGQLRSNEMCFYRVKQLFYSCYATVIIRESTKYLHKSSESELSHVDRE